MILDGKVPPKPKKDEEEGEEEEEKEEKDEEIDMDEAGEADVASVTPLPEQSPIQQIDPHATLTDEEHASLICETKDIYEDFEVGLDGVREVNIDGTATSECFMSSSRMFLKLAFPAAKISNSCVILRYFFDVCKIILIGVGLGFTVDMMTLHCCVS